VGQDAVQVGMGIDKTRRHHAAAGIHHFILGILLPQVGLGSHRVNRASTTRTPQLALGASGAL